MMAHIFNFNQAQTEHDLKKYYLDLCSSKESRIRELERSNDILRRKSFEREHNARSHSSSESEDGIGETPAVLHSLKKWGNSFKSKEATLEEEMADLRNENRRLLDRQKSLSAQLEVCQCSQLSKLELELHVLKTEKQSIRARLHATESELSTLKRDLEFATTALLDQAEAQKCYCSTLKPIYLACNEHTSFEEDAMQRHACSTNVSLDDRRRNPAPFGDIIGILGDELITMEISHKDELFLSQDTARDQMRQINRVESDLGIVAVDAVMEARSDPLSYYIFGRAKTKSMCTDFGKCFSRIEDRLLGTQKRAILLEIENVCYKKQLVLAEKLLIIMKKMEKERDGLKLQLLSLRTELKDMERHRDESFCLSGQALLRTQRHMLHFDIEKRGWTMEKTRLEDGLFHASRNIERLIWSQTKITRKLAESERDMEEMRGKIVSLETERELLVSELGEMALGIQDLAAGKEEIVLAFLKSLEKLEALQTEKDLLSNHCIHSRIETGKIELELHEKVRKIDILETATESLLREQRANIAPRISLLKDLYKANVGIVSLRQTCEFQRKEHQRDKEQLLLKMAKMSVCSGEFQKQNSGLRRELLALGTAKFRHDQDSLKQSRRERELVKQLVGCHLESMQLKRNQIESQEHLQQSKETMQAACIQVAFLKEAIDEGELNMSTHVPDLICQGEGGVQESRVSASYRKNDTQIASLQLTELVMSRTTIPLKMSSLRRWHSFAFAKRFHHKSSHTSTDLAEKLTEAQRKISRLKTIRAKSSDLRRT
jgi:anti-sigma28 factor (negative regulator of flagellin synthesis)